MPREEGSYAELGAIRGSGVYRVDTRCLMEAETDIVRLLLVEDDEEDYLLTRDRLLEAEGHRFAVEWVGSVAEAQKQLPGNFDAVLLDLTLPDSAGWETFESVHGYAPQLPLILLTGVRDEELGIRAVHEGAEDYLVKGQLTGPLLCRGILYAIERKRTRMQLERVARELRERNEQFASDLRMAREVQQAFLARRYPQLPDGVTPGQEAIRFCHLYRPSRLVGGDFLSIFRISGHQAGVFVCDVMGHGMRAALVTAIVRGLLERLKHVADDAGRFMTEINRDLTAVLRMPDEVVFASALYLIVDIQEGVVYSANAGHPCALLVRAKTQTVEDTNSSPDALGPALALDSTATYRATRHEIQPGDAVIVFTDGLHEAVGPDGDYGLQRVRDCLERHAGASAEGLTQVLLTDVERFTGQSEFADDICLVGIDIRRLVE